MGRNSKNEIELKSIIEVILYDYQPFSLKRIAKLLALFPNH
jgi:hypothetical protein